jgi:DNA-binding protein YbaB
MANKQIFCRALCLILALSSLVQIVDSSQYACFAPSSGVIRHSIETAASLPSGRHHYVHPSNRPHAETKLYINKAFSWFTGSNGENQNESSTEKASESLGGVAGIMDSMESFKTSQRVGERTNGVLQDLSNIQVEGTAADGKVQVRFNGNGRPMGVNIDDGYFQNLKKKKDGVEELNIAVTKAMQDAHSKSAEKMDERLKSFYSDLGFNND